jgi:hypothetical protein
MKISIDISDCVNGWRVDIIDATQQGAWGPTATTHKENFETSYEAFKFVSSFMEKKLTRVPPYDTMEVQ